MKSRNSSTASHPGGNLADEAAAKDRVWDIRRQLIDDCPRGGIDGDEDGDEDFDEGGGEACEDMIDYYEDQIEAAFGMLPGCEHCMDDFLECAWTGCDPNDPNGTVSPCWTAATQCITQDCVMDY